MSPHFLWPADQPVVAHRRLLIEPLVGSFPALLQTVSPVPSALRLARAQLPTLRSYLEAPEIHAAAAADPATKGGPFVDCSPDHLPLVTRLAAELAQETDLLQLATDVIDVLSLVDGADGSDLSALYPRVAPGLRGMVELVYDLRHQARVLFREPLFYRSRYASTRREAVYLTLADSDDRPFVLSTPRLTTETGVVVAAALASDAVATIVRARTEPVPFGDLVAAAGPEASSIPVFDSLWTSATEPTAPPRWEGGARIRYFGHACLCFETADVTILTDPFLSPTSGSDRFGLDDIPPRIDVCLVTHGHADHFVLESLLALRDRIDTVVVPVNLAGELTDPSLRLCLRQLGFRNIVEVASLDEIQIPGGVIVAWPFVGEHGDLAIGAKTTYLVRLAGHSTLVGADTRGLQPELFASLRDWYGPVDDVFLGLECEGAPLTWMYNPMFPKPVARSLSLGRRLNGADADEAMAIIRSLAAGRVFVYAMGEEPWLQHVMTTNYTEDSYQLRQAAHLASACSTAGVEYRYLRGRATIASA